MKIYKHFKSGKKKRSMVKYKYTRVSSRKGERRFGKGKRDVKRRDKKGRKT